MKNKEWSKYLFDKLELETLHKETNEEKRKICRLYRGRENWSGRVWDSDKEPTEDERDDIYQEVRALSSNWIKMQNLTLLMGAGASKCVLNFVGKDIYEKIKKHIGNRPSKQTLEKIEKMSSLPNKINFNFEEFLSQLNILEKVLSGTNVPLDKMSECFKITNGLKSDELKKLIKDIQRIIISIFNVELCNSCLTAKASEENIILPHEAFFAKLLSRDPQQGRIKVFTTNYDTIIEQSLDRLRIQYFDGFSGTVNRRFDPSSYDLDLYYPGDISEGHVRRYDKVLHLYKLHGSINWRRSNIIAGDPFGIYFDSGKFPNEKDIEKDNSKIDAILQVEDECLGILPVSSKYAETMTMPYAHLFRAMLGSLKQPQTVCFLIGYRGWDEHINKIIEDSLANSTFNCIIIDPFLSDWTYNLLKNDLCGRVYAFLGEWAKFEEFSLNVLPDLSVLETDIRIAKTLRELQKNKTISTDHKDK